MLSIFFTSYLRDGACFASGFLRASAINAIAFRCFLVSYCLLRHFTKGKGLNSSCWFFFLMSSYCLWTHPVFVQYFRLSPAGFSRLPSLYPSLLLFSSLCSTPPPQVLPDSDLLTLSSLSCGWGVGVTEERTGEIGHPGITHTHTHMHNACKMNAETDYRGNVVSVGKTHKQASLRLFVSI